MRDCGRNRKKPAPPGIDPHRVGVYASALRPLCVFVPVESPASGPPGPLRASPRVLRSVRRVIPEMREGSPFGCLAHLCTYCR